jgi:hypothetical protein
MRTWADKNCGSALHVEVADPLLMTACDLTMHPILR